MPIEDLEYAQFKKRVLPLTGIDLNDYKPEQMLRRLKTMLLKVNAASLTEYARILQSDAARLQEFRDFLTINVSEFFRDPKSFEQLRQQVLPLLLKNSLRLKIWSAGCSIGAEPYTIAMLLDSLAPLTRHRIVATDIDQTILARAKTGKGYLPSDVKGLPADYRAKYLVEKNGLFDVIDRIRDRVEFKVQNLLSDRFEPDCDLILCRNVVIYFTDEAKDALYRRFQQSLRPGGFLFVGGTEVVSRATEIGLLSYMTSFYRRAA